MIDDPVCPLLQVMLPSIPDAESTVVAPLHKSDPPLDEMVGAEGALPVAKLIGLLLLLVPQALV